MFKCIKCGWNTEEWKPLCTKCYIEDKKNKKEINWLTQWDYNFHYNMIKGRIAETLIQELFLSLDFNVFRYGMENVIPWIMELLKGVRWDVAENIKRMPDFVVHNPKTNSVYFVEVKFRADESFSIEDLEINYPYNNAYFILVSKKHIKCITYTELKEWKQITPTSKNYLWNRKEFDLKKDVIISFCEFAVKFFECV